MRVLGIDTATWIASVGIVDDGRRLAQRSRGASPSHGLSLLPLIDEVLDESGLSLEELDGVAVSIGPGSFTGLRIGLSTAKGFAFASALRLVGIPTLESLARVAAVGEGLVCPLLDARKGEVYTALYRAQDGELEAVHPECAVRLQVWLARIDGPCTFIGDAAHLVREENAGTFPRRVLPFEEFHPLGSMVAEMGARRLSRGEKEDLASLEPLYVRPSEAELKHNRSALAVDERC